MRAVLARDNSDSLPNFTLEPTLSRKKITDAVLGFCITYVGPKTPDEAPVTTPRSEYLPLARFNGMTREATIHEEFEAVLGNPEADTASAVEAWWTGFRAMSTNFLEDDLDVDPISHTFELTEVLERHTEGPNQPKNI